MGILRMLGFGNQKIISMNRSTAGWVTSTYTCWWIKINTKPVRTHALDGARFPHIIRFSYEVDGTIYSGRRFVDYNLRCPLEGERITVYYDPHIPAKYAVELI